MSAHIFRDFSQRYAGTYLKARIKGENEDVYYIGDIMADRDVAADNDKFAVALIGQKTERELRPRFCDIEFDYNLPRSKVIEYHGAVLFVSQRADRQWHRGISSHTYHIQCPTRSIWNEMHEVLSLDYEFPQGMGSLFSNEGRLNWGNAAVQLYDQYYGSYLDAHAALRGMKNMGVVFSEHYFLSLSAIDGGLTWWRDCLPIAQVDIDEPFKINCFENGMFRQEIADFLGRKGFYNVEIR